MTKNDRTPVRLPPPPLPRWLARRLPFERSLVSVGPYRMHVMEAGPGAPRRRGAAPPRTVLLLHGNPTWGFLWRKVAAALKGEPLHLVIPDLVGLGLSDKPRAVAAHSLENHAAWLRALVRALDLRDVVLVGQDWGGPIGVLAFAEERARLAGLVVLNTGLGPPRTGFRPTFFHRLSHVPLLSDALFRGLAFPQCCLTAIQGRRTSILGANALAYLWPLRAVRDRTAPLALARMVPNRPDHPSLAPLARVRDAAAAWDGPAAIVWGDRDPILGRLRGRTERLLPRATVTRTDAGHFLQEEVPEAIAAAIRAVAGLGGLSAPARTPSP